jgi:hypothetical protein
MSRKHLEEWLQRKLNRTVVRLTGMVTIGYEYKRVVGPRSIYAGVSILVTPNDEIEFETKPDWPGKRRDEPMIFDGILDALVGWEYGLLVARFTVVEVGYDPVNSAPIAYYWAAKRAVQSLLMEKTIREE